MAKKTVTAPDIPTRRAEFTMPITTHRADTTTMASRHCPNEWSITVNETVNTPLGL